MEVFDLFTASFFQNNEIIISVRETYIVLSVEFGLVDSIKGTVAVWTWLVELEQLVHGQRTLGGVTRPMKCESLVLKKLTAQNQVWF